MQHERKNEGNQLKPTTVSTNTRTFGQKDVMLIEEHHTFTPTSMERLGWEALPDNRQGQPQNRLTEELRPE
jgi:hypothetical protein